MVYLFDLTCGWFLWGIPFEAHSLVVGFLVYLGVLNPGVLHGWGCLCVLRMYRTKQLNQRRLRRWPPSPAPPFSFYHLAVFSHSRHRKQLSPDGEKLLITTATKGLCLVPTDDLDLARSQMFGEKCVIFLFFLCCSKCSSISTHVLPSFLPATNAPGCVTTGPHGCFGV